jgi:hypothetical protein
MVAKSETSFGTAENVHLLRLVMLMQGGVNAVIVVMWLALGLLFPIYNGSQGGGPLTLLVLTGIFWVVVLGVGAKIDGKLAVWIWASGGLQALSVVLWVVSLVGNLSPVSFINLAVSLVAVGFAASCLYDLKDKTQVV